MNQKEIREIEALEEYEVFEPIGTLKGYVGTMPQMTGIKITPYIMDNRFGKNLGEEPNDIT